MLSSRRSFLKTALALSAIHPLPLRAGETAAGKKIRLGIITDIHKDLVPDADERLTAFIQAMTLEKVDAVLQMGDFCQPKPANRDFLGIFNSFAGPKYHVLGNHDMDGGFKREQTVAYYGMPARYYSFDLGGFHFVVLDGNDRPEGWKGGYPHYFAADQLAWLREDLEKTRLNTFVFSHQSLERPACIDNQAEARALLEAAKMPDGTRKVAACLNGHWHIDHERLINGIPYLHVNSASYFYMGGAYTQELAPELKRKFPTIAAVAAYAGPLFTVLEIDPAAGKFSLRGMKSEWLGKSPQELNYRSPDVESGWLNPAITAVEERIG